MNVEITLQKEIEESEKLLNGPIDDTIYKRTMSKRIQLVLLTGANTWMLLFALSET